MKFYLEVDKLKKTLLKNSCPQNFIAKCIQNILNNIFLQKSQVPTEPKKELLIILLYSCKTSEVVKTRLPKTISKHLNFAKLKVIFQTSNKLKDYFFFKYFVLETLWSNSIYKFLWEAAQPHILGKSSDTSK